MIITFLMSWRLGMCLVCLCRPTLLLNYLQSPVRVAGNYTGRFANAKEKQENLKALFTTPRTPGRQAEKALCAWGLRLHLQPKGWKSE
jgi:hypothetical protein